MAYVACKKCGGYYKLDSDEFPEDFDKCQCGGELQFFDSLDDYLNSKEYLDSIDVYKGESADFKDIIKSKLSNSSSKVSKVLNSDENVYRSLGIVFTCSILILILGVFAIYPIYQSSVFDSHLGNANSAIILAKSNLSQVEPISKPVDENIIFTENALNHTEVAISEVEMMLKNAPDEDTKKYAELRLSQYEGVKRHLQLSLSVLNEMKVSGVFGAIPIISYSESETNRNWADIHSKQDEIIQLVNNNPKLRQRLINVLGEEMVDKSLEPTSSKGNFIPYA